MELAFQYSGRDRSGRAATGLVLADDREQAQDQLEAMGVTSADLSVDLLSTAQSTLSQSFPIRELAMYYRGVANRLTAGKSAPQALGDNTRFVRNPRLKQAIAIATHAGQANTLPRALQIGGFPDEHTALLEAVSKAGGLAQALFSLAANLRRQAKLNSDVRKALMPIAIALLLLAGVVYGAMLIFIPKFYDLFQQRNWLPIMNPAIKVIYSLCSELAKTPVLFTICYIGALVAIIAGARAGWFRPIYSLLPGMNALIQRWTHLRLWSAYQTMLVAGETHGNMMRKLAASVKDQELEEMLHACASEVDQGKSFREVIEQVQFPDFVQSHLEGAEDGKLDEALTHLLSETEDEAETYKEIVVESAKTVAIVTTAATLIFVVAITYAEYLRITVSKL